jgi:hypothetical protein
LRGGIFCLLTPKAGAQVIIGGSGNNDVFVVTEQLRVRR